MAYFCSSNDKRNFQWVTVATLDLIKLPLKDILASQIKPVDLFQKILSCSTLMLRTDQRKLCLIQPPGLPDYNTFDVTLLYTLIRNLCGLPSPAQGWGKEPKATDTQISDDIERLRLFRNNYYAHANSASISDDVFEDVWRNLKLAIKRFNSKTRSNTDYEEELIMIERSKFTDDHLKTCRILLDALANLHKKTDSRDEPDISIKGENEIKCGETALFEAVVEKVKSSSWTITWQKRKRNFIECIDTSMKKYSGSTKRKLVIKSVCKEDEGDYQVVLSFESSGPEYRSKNTIRLYVLEDVPSVKIFVDSPVCFGSRSTIKSEVSSTTRLEKIEWKKSEDGIDFHCTENPIHSKSTANFTSPCYVIPKTTFNDKLYYRLLVWNENEEGDSNTVFLNVTGNYKMGCRTLNSDADVDKMKTGQALRKENNRKRKLEEMDFEEKLEKIVKLRKDVKNDPVHKRIEQLMEEIEKIVDEEKGQLDAEHEDEEEILKTLLRKPNANRTLEASRNSPAYVQWCCRLQEKAIQILSRKPDPSQRIRLGGEYLKTLSELLEVNDCLTRDIALEVLKKKMEDIKVESITKNEKMLARLMISLQSDLQKMHADSAAQANSAKNFNVLLETMEDNILKDKANGGPTKFIIFVKTIEVAKRLSEMLKIKAYTCESLIGTRAMSQTDQIIILDKFRERKIQGIVATSVAEEGIDIPDCDLVILYNYIGNEIAYKQAMGQARKLEAKIIVLGNFSDYHYREAIKEARLKKIEQDAKMNRSENFEEKIRNIIEEEVVAVVAEKELMMFISSLAETKPDGAANYRLVCKCGHFEIDCSVLRCIDNTNYAALDVKLGDKIEENPLTIIANITSDLVMQSEWNHQGCQKKLGTIFLYKGVRLLYLAQKSFSYDTKAGDRPLPVQQWKKLPFQIPALTIKELLEHKKLLTADGKN